MRSSKGSTWNYRILVWENYGEVYYQIHSVFYHDEKPEGYSQEGAIIGADSLDSFKWEFSRLQEALEKPCISGDHFPEEYK